MSTILVNTLTGTSTAGSIVVTGEGNSTTTNLQQGLAKAWNNLSFSGASISDSFNTASITDNATGRFTCSFTNSFANANYSSAGSSRFSLTDADVSNRGVSHQPATNSVSIVSFRTDTGALTDDAGVDSQFHGDLA
jgi:hypothetical protein